MVNFFCFGRVVFFLIVYYGYDNWVFNKEVKVFVVVGYDYYFVIFVDCDGID